MDTKKIEILDAITLIAAGLSCAIANNEAVFDCENAEEIADLVNPSPNALSKFRELDGVCISVSAQELVNIVRYFQSVQG